MTNYAYLLPESARSMFTTGLGQPPSNVIFTKSPLAPPDTTGRAGLLNLFPALKGQKWKP